MAISPDNSRLAIAVNSQSNSQVNAQKIENTGQVHIWNLETQQVIYSYKIPPAERIEYVTFSPDGKWLAATGTTGTATPITDPNLPYLQMRPADFKIYQWDSYGYVDVEVNVPAALSGTYAYGDFGVGSATNYVFFDKVGPTFETQPLWDVKINLKTSVALIFEFFVSIGVADPTGNVLGIDFGGPCISLVFTLTLEGLFNPTSPSNLANALLAEKKNPNRQVLNSDMNALIISMYLQVQLQFSLKILIQFKILGYAVATLYENECFKDDLWSWGGEDTGLLLRIQAIYKGDKRVCPFNMRFSRMDGVNFPVYTTDDKNSIFYWPASCTATSGAVLPKACSPGELYEPTGSEKKCLASQETISGMKWTDITLAAPRARSPREKILKSLQIAASAREPESSNMFFGVCDGEAFKYVFQLTFVDRTRANLDIMISLGPKSGMHIADNSCTLRGLYRLKGAWVYGKVIEFVRVRNQEFDSDGCWMQKLPQVIQAKPTDAGENSGIWLSFPAVFCADIHLRYGSVSVLEPGNVLLNDQTMQSAPPMAQLILHSDGNLALYAYDSDFLIYESSTGSTGSKKVLSSLSVSNGMVLLENLVDGVKTSKVLNPNGVAGGRYLAMVDCDLQLFADSVILPGQSLWNLTNKPCPTFSRSRSPPRWHRGGSYLYQGETLLPNAGLMNGNGYFQHERGLLHFVHTNTQESLWSLTDENIRSVRTSAFSFLWDGNLVLYDYEGNVVWESKTSGRGATVLRLERCALVLYKTYPNSGKVWSYGDLTDCRDTPDAEPLEWPAAVSSYPTPLGQMEPGHNLGPGQALLSGFGMLYHQLDGNLVIISRDNTTMSTPLWSSNTAGKCTTSLMFQYDGSLILYGCSGEVVWTAGLASTRAKLIEFLDDCTLNVLDSKFHSHAITSTTISKVLNTQKCPSQVPIMKLIDHAECWWVQTGFYLSRAQFIATLTFTLALGLQPDGDLVFYATNPTRILWRSGTSGKCVSKMDIVEGIPSLYDCQGYIMWSLANLSSIPLGVEYLVITNTGGFVLQDSNFDNLWSSEALKVSTVTPEGSLVPPATTSDCNNPNNTILISVLSSVLVSVAWGIVTISVYWVMKKRIHVATVKGDKQNTTELTTFHSPPHHYSVVNSQPQLEENKFSTNKNPVEETF